MQVHGTKSQTLTRVLNSLHALHKTRDGMAIVEHRGCWENFGQKWTWGSQALLLKNWTINFDAQAKKWIWCLSRSISKLSHQSSGMKVSFRRLGTFQGFSMKLTFISNKLV